MNSNENKWSLFVPEIGDSDIHEAMKESMDNAEKDIAGIKAVIKQWWLRSLNGWR